MYRGHPRRRDRRPTTACCARRALAGVIAALEHDAIRHNDREGAARELHGLRGRSRSRLHQLPADNGIIAYEPGANLVMHAPGYMEGEHLVRPCHELTWRAPLRCRAGPAPGSATQL